MKKFYKKRIGLALLGALFSLFNVKCRIPKEFSTVDNLMLSKNVQVGQPIYIKGFYKENDGGEGIYYLFNENTSLPSDFIEVLHNNGRKIGLRAKDLVQINLRQLGARGIKNQNSTIYLDKAIKLSKQYNLPIYIPKGEYIVQKKDEFLFRISRQQNFVLKGEGRNKTVIRLINPKAGGRNIFFFRQGIQKIEISDITFRGTVSLDLENLEKDPTLYKAGDISHRAIYALEEIQEIYIKNCQFLDFTGIAVQLSHQGKKVDFDNVIFKNCIRETQGNGAKQAQATGIMVNKGVIDLKISNSQFYNIIDLGKNGLSHAIYLQNVQEGEIFDCTFKMDNKLSFDLYRNNGIQIYNGDNKKLTIHNNTFENTQSNLYNMRQIIVKNNSFINSRLVLGTDNITVTNNTFELSKSTSMLGLIRTASKVKKISIYENDFKHIEGSSKYAIGVQFYRDCSDSKVINNRFENFHASFLMGGVANVAIQHNTFKDNDIIVGNDTKYMVIVRSGEHNTIEDNNIIIPRNTKTKDIKIYTEGLKNGKIKENSFKNNRINN